MDHRAGVGAKPGQVHQGGVVSGRCLNTCFVGDTPRCFTKTAEVADHGDVSLVDRGFGAGGWFGGGKGAGNTIGFDLVRRSSLDDPADALNVGAGAAKPGYETKADLRLDQNSARGRRRIRGRSG